MFRVLLCDETPVLPGRVFRNFPRCNYKKAQSLVTVKGINMVNERRPHRSKFGKFGCACCNNEDDERTKRSPDLCQPSDMVERSKWRPMRTDYSAPVQELSLYPASTSSKLPKWIEYDRIVLCFYAYFMETVHGSYFASYEVRKVKIKYYLEDDTMKINKLKTDNSPMCNICLVRRQRLRKPPPHQWEYITVLDLNVATCVQILDRVYHITNCDAFTRHFLTKSGIAVPDPLPVPMDPSTERQRRCFMRRSQSGDNPQDFAALLSHDKMVLTFYGYWQDRSDLDDPGTLELCYYLADDTIDIKEHLPNRTMGQEPQIYCKRAKLHKTFTNVSSPGKIYQDSEILLDVLGISKVRNVNCDAEDPLRGERMDVVYYTAKDLKIATVLDVYGRALVITDCNDFTDNYYRNKHGKEFACHDKVPEPASDTKPVTKPVPDTKPECNLKPDFKPESDSELFCCCEDPEPIADSASERVRAPVGTGALNNQKSEHLTDSYAETE